MSGELIEIRVRIPSRAHKFLSKRALRLGREREEEAGRILQWACMQLIERAAKAANAPERTYTQAEVDAQMATARRAWDYQRRRREWHAEREAPDGQS